MQGTIVWMFLDDLGKTPTSHTANSYRLCQMPHTDNCHCNIGAKLPLHTMHKTQSRWVSTYHVCRVLHWNLDMLYRTVPLEKRSNVARLMTAPGSKHFRAQEVLVQACTFKIIPICFHVNMVSPDNNNPIIHAVQSTNLRRKEK